MNTAFSLKQLGHLDYFLELEIKYFPNNSILMTQSKYIRDLLHKTHMAEAYSISSPIIASCPGLVLICFMTQLSTDQWWVLCNMLLSLDLKSVLLSIKFVNLWLVLSLVSHWAVVKRILRYLKGTLSHGLLLQPASITKPLAFYAFCDAE